MINILIIEDEIPAFKKLYNYTKEYFRGNFSYQHIRSVEEGIEVLTENSNFDLIISDIELIGGTAFDIFKSIDLTIPIIFCTAYDEHILKAFKTYGIAYILKPYSKADLFDSLEKFQKITNTNKNNDKKLFKEFNAILTQNSRSYKKRFAIKKRKGIKLIEVNNICCIEAFGDISKLYDNNGELHIVSQNIGSILSELNPKQFFRVSRSYIVQIDYIENIVSYSKNRLSIKMKTPKVRIITSTSTTKEFRKWINQ